MKMGLAAHGVRRRAVFALLPLALSAPALASYVEPSGSGGVSSVKPANIRGMAAIDDDAARREAITALLQSVVSGDWADLLNKGGINSTQRQQWLGVLSEHGLTTQPPRVPQRLWVAQMVAALMASRYNPWTMTDPNENPGAHPLPDNPGNGNPPANPPGVPEPTAGLLLFAAAAGLMLKRRRGPRAS